MRLWTDGQLYNFAVKLQFFESKFQSMVVLLKKLLVFQSLQALGKGNLLQKLNFTHNEIQIKNVLHAFQLSLIMLKLIQF